MIQSHSNESPDELEIMQMVRIDIGGRVYLETVVVLVGVLEKTVHRIQNFVGEEEEPLSAKNTDMKEFWAHVMPTTRFT